MTKFIQMFIRFTRIVSKFTDSINNITFFRMSRFLIQFEHILLLYDITIIITCIFWRRMLHMTLSFSWLYSCNWGENPLFHSEYFPTGSSDTPSTQIMIEPFRCLSSWLVLGISQMNARLGICWNLPVSWTKYSKI